MIELLSPAVDFSTGKPVSALAPRYCSPSAHCPWLVVNPQSPCSDPFAPSTPAPETQSTPSVAPVPETSSTVPHPASAAHSQTAVRSLHASPTLHANELRNCAPLVMHYERRPELFALTARAVFRVFRLQPAIGPTALPQSDSAKAN